MSHHLPPLTNDQLSRYFSRIQYRGEADKLMATLQALHALHPLHIPFENLNSFVGLPVSLDPETIFEKLVSQQRGGYCFEQNQLFMRVLQTLGFQVQGLSARVLWMLADNTVVPRTHMVLRVTVDGISYLADVGFGGLTMTAAIAMNNPDAQNTPHEPFRIRTAGELFIVSVYISKQWQDLYQFSLDPCLPIDYETANWYVSTYPQSRFVNQLICCRADTDARHSLLNNRYSRYVPGTVAEAKIFASVAELENLLLTTFGIKLEALPDLQHRLSDLIRESSEQ